MYEQLRHVYFDTALVINESALAALTTFCSPSQILLARQRRHVTAAS
jgi:hypothetical protein